MPRPNQVAFPDGQGPPGQVFMIPPPRDDPGLLQRQDGPAASMPGTCRRSGLLVRTRRRSPASSRISLPGCAKTRAVGPSTACTSRRPCSSDLRSGGAVSPDLRSGDAVSPALLYGPPWGGLRPTGRPCPPVTVPFASGTMYSATTSPSTAWTPTGTASYSRTSSPIGRAAPCGAKKLASVEMWLPLSLIWCAFIHSADCCAQPAQV